MTFKPIAPWVPLEELMSLPRGERIKYVRENLKRPIPGGKFPHLNQDEFAVAVGGKDRHGPIRWEKGGVPRDYAGAIAALTPYPPAAFGADGEAELVQELFATRLARVEGALDALGARLQALQPLVEQGAGLGQQPRTRKSRGDAT